MKNIRKRLITVVLTLTVTAMWIAALPSFAFTVGTENVQMVVSEAAADSTGKGPIITVDEVEPSVETETIEVMPSVPCIPPEMIVTDVQSMQIPSVPEIQSDIMLTTKPPEFEIQAKELQAQTLELNRQLLAYDNRTAQASSRKQSDKAAWEAYRGAYSEILSARWKQAVTSLNNVEKKYGKSDWADDAAYWGAYAFEKSGEDPEQVYKQYQSFVDRYPGSRWVETARGNMVGIANRLAMSGNPEFADKIRMVGFDGNLSVTLSALTALQMMGEDAIPEMETLYMKTSNPVTKERILSTVLANRSPKSTNFLIRVAETDSSDMLRKKAVDFIGSSLTYNRQAAEVFSNGTTITVTPRPKTAALEDKKAVLDALGRVARDDPSEVVRGQALYWLGKSGTDEGWVKFLETAAKTDPSMEVRQKALLSLSQMPDGKGVPGLIAVAKSDGSVSIRSIAITYLGMSKDPRAKEALREIVRQGD